jgi:hypothetical protein
VGSPNYNHCDNANRDRLAESNTIGSTVDSGRVRVALNGHTFLQLASWRWHG